MNTRTRATARIALTCLDRQRSLAGVRFFFLKCNKFRLLGGQVSYSASWWPVAVVKFGL